MKRHMRLLFATFLAVFALNLGCVTALAAEYYSSLDEAVSSLDGRSAGTNLSIGGVGDFQYKGTIEDNAVMGGAVDIDGYGNTSVIYKAGDGAILYKTSDPKIIFKDVTTNGIKLIYSIGDPTVIEVYGDNIITKSDDAGFLNNGNANIKLTGDGNLTIDAIAGIQGSDIFLFTNELTGQANFSVVSTDAYSPSGKTANYYTFYGNCALKLHPSLGTSTFELGETYLEANYITLAQDATLTIPEGTVLDYMTTLNASLDTLGNYLISDAAGGKLIVDGELWLPSVSSNDEAAKAINNVMSAYQITGNGAIKVQTTSGVPYTLNVIEGTLKDEPKTTPTTKPANPSPKTNATTVPATKIKSLKKAKKSFKVKWTKKSSVSGYEIKYSTSKKFKKKASSTTKVKGANKSSKKIKKLKGKKLKSNKRYYVKVRAYKVVNGKTYYSKWSKVKSVKTK